MATINSNEAVEAVHHAAAVLGGKRLGNPP